MPVGSDEIRHRFGHHPVTAAMKQKHETVQEAFIAFAEYLDSVLPDGRAKGKAFNKLQETAFWANYAIDAVVPAKKTKD